MGDWEGPTLHHPLLRWGEEAPRCTTRALLAVGGGVNSTYWYTAGERPFQNEPFLTWLLAVGQLPDAQLPRTYSVSYGDNENTVDLDVSRAGWGCGSGSHPAV